MERPIGWKALARARGLEIPEAELDLVVQRLQTLESAFRPLVGTLTPDQEPAPVFRPEPETE